MEHEERANKRRRLATACPPCRKVKARCEPRPNDSKCFRCHALDMECDLPARSITRELTNEASGIEGRLRRVEETLETLLATLPRQNTATAANHQLPITTEVIPELPSGQSDHPQPIKIIRDLQSEFFGEKQSSADEQGSSFDVASIGLLSDQEVEHVLQQFVEHYGNAVSISTPSEITRNSSMQNGLLSTTACLLGARFVSSITQQSLSSLYEHVRRLIADATITAPPLYLDTIRAMSLISTWSPTVRMPAAMDSWVLSSVAASHAMLSFKVDRSQVPQSAKAARDLRLWSNICLTHLQHSIGNGRPLGIPTLLIDQCSKLIQSDYAFPTDAQLIAEISLYLILYKQLRGEHFRAVHLERSPEVSAWASTYQGLLDQAGPPSALQLGWWFSRLIWIRRAIQSNNEEDGQLKTDALRLGATIVSQFVRPDPTLPSDFPDFVFFIAAYAALVLCESAIDYHLVEILQRYLEKVALNDMHIAHRHAQILDRALQRNRGSEINHATAQHMGDVPGDFLGYEPFESSLNGFDVFGELFPVDSLL